MREYFQRTLPAIGHQVVGAASTGMELIGLYETLKPDLVITDIKMPDLDGIDAAKRIHQVRPAPVILVSAYNDSDLIGRAGQEQILAYLVKPIKQADLEPTIALTMSRFAQFEALRIEANGLRQALEDRKIIERAKGILMLLRRATRGRRISPAAKAGPRSEPKVGGHCPNDRDRGESLAAIVNDSRSQSLGIEHFPRGGGAENIDRTLQCRSPQKIFDISRYDL